MKKVMRNKKVMAMMVVGLVAIFLTTSGVLAQPPAGVGDPPVESKINYQGQLTDSGGNPLNSTYDMEFQFWDSENGGSPVGNTISESNVQVTNGLFNVQLPVNQADFNGQGLWLEVKVGTETLSPRQEILPVPYALSLKPGAVIGGAGAGDGSIYLKDVNDENVLELRADGAYLDIGGSGNEGDILVKNAADETTFDVSGDTGRIKSGADSYIFISGNDFVKRLYSIAPRWLCEANGSVKIWSGPGISSKSIYIPITVPGVLYGQEVTVEELTIYYKCQGQIKSVPNYITSTSLFRQAAADSSLYIINDQTDRKGIYATSYTLSLTQNNILSSDQGILGLCLHLHFEDDTNYIQIGGVRLRLSHSST